MSGIFSYIFLVFQEKEKKFPRLHYINSWKNNKEKLQAKLSQLKPQFNLNYESDIIEWKDITLDDLKAYMAIIIV